MYLLEKVEVGSHDMKIKSEINFSSNILRDAYFYVLIYVFQEMKNVS